MKEFTIMIPMTGYVEVTVQADDEDSAIDKAFELATLEDVAEWDLHRNITQGNVSHALKNEIEIYEN